MNGREVANAYTELNDPVTQAECFAQQAKVALQGALPFDCAKMCA